MRRAPQAATGLNERERVREAAGAGAEPKAARPARNAADTPGFLFSRALFRDVQPVLAQNFLLCNHICMNENKFAFRILLLYLAVLMVINMIAALIPSSLDLLTNDDVFLREWSRYMAENAALGNIAAIICFLLPAVFAILYALSALRAAEIEVVKKRIVNAPTIFSVTGAAGWLVNFIAEIFVLLYARTFLDIQIGYILFVSGIFLILEGLISFELSYYVLESMSRFWILPKFFPDGGVAKTKGVISPSFSVMFVEFFVAVSVCPVVSLLYMLGVVIKNSGADLHVNTLIVIAMFMLFAALVTFFFMKIFTVPLKKLSGMTERIKDGDFFRARSDYVERRTGNSGRFVQRDDRFIAGKRIHSRDVRESR